MTPPIAGTVLVVLVVGTTLDVVVLDVGVLEELDGAKATDGLGGGTTATEAVGKDAEEEDSCKLNITVKSTPPTTLSAQ